MDSEPERAQELQVETTGETIGEAKWQALRALERLHPGLDKAYVRFQVVSEGERGLLGVGYTPARVVATVDEKAVRAPVTVRAESDAAAAARDLVERTAAALGVRCRVDAREDDESVTILCSGADLGILIGKHGQTIDALQYLLNAIASRGESGRPKRVVVDAAGYRERREATLGAIALRSAERALTTRSPVELEPMSAAERKIVHLRLKGIDGVKTTSVGVEPNRFVVVAPDTQAAREDEGTRGGSEAEPDA
ncbi:MAG: KH domain-containing protein [Actinomycetota bacterium]|nr:KH domain-containing protein [Actinomycetota bacterium]